MRAGRACLAAALTAALTAALLAGCGAPTQKAAPAAETSGAAAAVLDVWFQSDNPSSAFNSKMEEAVSQYQQANSGTELALHSLDSSSYKEKLATDFTGKASDIDVFYDWAPAKLTQLVLADRVLPLDGYLSDEKLGEIKKDSQDSFTVDGKLYGLPMPKSRHLAEMRGSDIGCDAEDSKSYDGAAGGAQWRCSRKAGPALW